MKSLIHEILLREVRKMDVMTIEAFEKQLKKRKEDLIVKDLLLRLAPKDDAVIQDVLLNHFVGIDYTLGDYAFKDLNQSIRTILSGSVFFYDGMRVIIFDKGKFKRKHSYDRDDIKTFMWWLLRSPVPMYETGGIYLSPERTLVPICVVLNKLLCGIDNVEWGKVK